jgi:hypothetical protein
MKGEKMNGLQQLRKKRRRIYALADFITFCILLFCGVVIWLMYIGG